MEEVGSMVNEEGMKCHICKLLIQLSDKAVKDHCQFSGKFRGYAHNDCNLKYCLKNICVKVVSHNFRGYDKSILLQMKYFSEVECIPLMENSVTLSWNSSIDGDHVKFQFIDSFMHLSQPLEVLIQNQANYQPSQKFKNKNEVFNDFVEFIEKKDIKILRQSFPVMSLKYKNDKIFKTLQSQQICNKHNKWKQN